MQVGLVKLGEFRQITGYISKKYKIDAYFLLKSNMKSYALYRMVTLPMTFSDPQLPQITPICTFYTSFHIFVMGVVRNFEFDM